MPTPPTQVDSMLHSVSCRRINLSLTHPQLSIVASLGNGRLGNQLSNFASCYAIWKEYGMHHYLNFMQLNIIQKVFELPKFEEEDNNAPYYIWDPGKCLEKFSICNYIELTSHSIRQVLLHNPNIHLPLAGVHST